MEVSNLNIVNKGIDDALKNGSCIKTLKGEELEKVEQEIEAASHNFIGKPKKFEKYFLQTPNLVVSDLPIALQEWVADNSRRLGVPAEMFAFPAIASISALVGRKMAILPKKYDQGWKVYPSVLWCCLVGRPGVKKTPTMSAAMGPAREVEQSLIAEFNEEMKSKEVEKAVLEFKIQELGKKAKTKEDFAELIQLKDALTDLVGSPPRIFVEDTTIEQLGKIIEANPSGVMVGFDELSQLLAMFSKKHFEGARQFFLKAWSGNENYSVDRISRSGVYIEGLFALIMGGIQPGVIHNAFQRTLKQGMSDDGFIERFQLFVSHQPQNTLIAEDIKPNLTAYESVFKICSKARRMKPEDLGAKSIDGSGCYGVHFSEEAQSYFDRMLVDIDQQILKEEMASIESFMSKRKSAIPALALIFHIIEVVSTGEVKTSISLANLKRAEKCSDLAKDHFSSCLANAINVYEKGARELAAKILSKSISADMSLRDVYRKGWAHLNDKESVLKACDVLEEMNWLKVINISSGKRPKECIYINPKVYSQISELKESL